MGPLSHYIHIHLYIHFSHWHLTLFTLLIHTDIFYTLTFDPPLHFWLTQRYLSHIDPSLHFWFTQRYLSHIDIWPSLHYWFKLIFFTRGHLTLFTQLIHTDIFFHTSPCLPVQLLCKYLYTIYCIIGAMLICK